MKNATITSHQSVVSHPRHHAFTLIEIMVVVSIMAVMLGMAGLSLPKMFSSQQVSGAARQLAADLDHAAMLAQRDAKPVEVRIYKCKEPDGLGDDGFRAYQIGQITGWDGDGTPKVTFIHELQRLPSGVVFMENTTYSTIINPAAIKNPKPGEMPDKTASPYVAYQIRPDGGTNLPRGTNVKTALTLVAETPEGSPDTLPTDYRTIAIDPLNGEVRTY